MSTQVIFDLDGTLTDSREGIIRSVAYALTKEGETTAGRLAAETIIGPPLWRLFAAYFRGWR
ncbi:MAG: HAD hydrolase-like protein [Megasphaera lornae]